MQNFVKLSTFINFGKLQKNTSIPTSCKSCLHHAGVVGLARTLEDRKPIALDGDVVAGTVLVLVDQVLAVVEAHDAAEGPAWGHNKVRFRN